MCAGEVKRRNVSVAFRHFFIGVAAGGKQLDLALFQPEILRRLVGKELIAVGDNLVIQLMQIAFKMLL